MKSTGIHSPSFSFLPHSHHHLIFFSECVGWTGAALVWISVFLEISGAMKAANMAIPMSNVPMPSIISAVVSTAGWLMVRKMALRPNNGGQP